jgi:hypothetical protein
MWNLAPTKVSMYKWIICFMELVAFVRGKSSSKQQVAEAKVNEF